MQTVSWKSDKDDNEKFVVLVCNHPTELAVDMWQHANFNVFTETDLVKDIIKCAVKSERYLEQYPRVLVFKVSYESGGAECVFGEPLMKLAKKWFNKDDTVNKDAVGKDIEGCTEAYEERGKNLLLAMLKNVKPHASFEKKTIRGRKSYVPTTKEALEKWNHDDEYFLALLEEGRLEAEERKKNSDD